MKNLFLLPFLVLGPMVGVTMTLLRGLGIAIIFIKYQDVICLYHHVDNHMDVIVMGAVAWLDYDSSS